MPVTRSLPRVAGDERGFSLVELIVAMAIGSIILTVLLNVFLNGMTSTSKVTDRVEATQRARVSTDVITSLLQAQVCVDGVAPISDAQATSVTFTAIRGDVQADPVRYRLRYDAPTRAILEDRWIPTADASGTLSWPSTPSSTQTITTNVVPVNGAIFRYFAFDATGNVPDTPLAAPLSDSDRQQVVRVGTALTAIPARTKVQDPRSTTVEGQAIVAGADPTNPSKGPNC